MPLDTRGIDILQFTHSDWGGGLNLRDNPSQLGPSESPDAYNVTVDDRGGVGSRLGFTKWNTSMQPAALIKTGYYSEVLGKKLWQAGADLYTQTGSSAFSASIKTFSNSTDRVSMVDFVDKVWVAHPTDGIFHYDGTTFSSAVVGAPDAVSLAVWQNKLWAAETNTSDLWASAAGDGTVWDNNGALENSVRAVNDEPLTCLIASELEGLLVFKETSAYKVYDSFTGAYQTLSATYGACSSQAATACLGRVFCINRDGIYATDGFSPLIPVSERFRTMFRSDTLALAQNDVWCAGTQGDKVYFSVTVAGATANNLAFEMHALREWVMPHSCAASTYVLDRSGDDILLGGAPSVNGQVYKLYADIGTDDGTAITARYQTAWFRPNRLHLCSVHQLRIRGRGIFTMYVKADATSGDGEAHPVDLSGPALDSWDTGSTWDSGELWGPSAFEGDDVIYSIGVGRDFSFEIQATTTDVGAAPAPVGLGTAPTLGSWALYTLTCDYTPLGVS